MPFRINKLFKLKGCLLPTLSPRPQWNTIWLFVRLVCLFCHHHWHVSSMTDLKENMTCSSRVFSVACFSQIRIKLLQGETLRGEQWVSVTSLWILHWGYPGSNHPFPFSFCSIQEACDVIQGCVLSRYNYVCVKHSNSRKAIGKWLHRTQKQALQDVQISFPEFW